MKKVMMMIALLAIPFALQAQTKFHDLEVNDAKGPVKSITTTMMGMSRTIGHVTHHRVHRRRPDGGFFRDFQLGV